MNDLSYYYDYYIGTKDKDDKIKPLGPYDINNKLHSALCKSRSFASRLYERFYPVKDEQITEELRMEFKYKDWNGNETVDVKYLPLSELPSGTYIKKGFYLIEDIEKYEKHSDESVFDLDIFYDWIPESTYYRMLEAQRISQISPIHRKVLDEDNDYEEHRDLSKYSYYCYPDYECEEYEAAVIRTVAYIYDKYDVGLPDDSEIVILETEG